MKKLILLFVTVFAFQFSQAQYNIDIAEATPQQEQKADKQSKMLTKKLGLNGEQPLLVRNLEVRKHFLTSSTFTLSIPVLFCMQRSGK